MYVSLPSHKAGRLKRCKVTFFFSINLKLLSFFGGGRCVGETEVVKILQLLLWCIFSVYVLCLCWLVGLMLYFSYDWLHEHLVEVKGMKRSDEFSCS